MDVGITGLTGLAAVIVKTCLNLLDKSHPHYKMNYGTLQQRYHNCTHHNKGGDIYIYIYIWAGGEKKKRRQQTQKVNLKTDWTINLIVGCCKN